MSVIVTLTEYKRAIGETNAARDQYHQDALDAAEAAVLNWTDRDFASTQVTESRTYEYDGSGVLNIDDCDAVNTVTLGAGSPLAATAWRAESEGPVKASGIYDWLKLPVVDWSVSRTSLGEMGFTYNLDQFIGRGGLAPTRGQGGTIDVTVNAHWGWPTPPQDVKRAVIFTGTYLETITPSSGAGGGLSSKSVADVAESFFADQQQSIDLTQAGDPLPPVAVAILAPYQRH